MKTSTHLAFGLVFTTTSFAFVSVPLHQDLPAIACTLLGSMAPDLDSRKSALGWALPGVAHTLERAWGHRMVTHCLAALLLLGLLLLPAAWYRPTWYAAFLLGYASHLLADCATKSGAPLFHPSSSLCVLPSHERYRFQTGSLAEQLLLVVLLFLLLLVFPLSRAGGVWHGLRYVAATQAMAYREYRDAPTQSMLDFQGRWRESHQPVQGQAPILEATQYRFLIVFGGQVLVYSEVGDILPDRSRVQVTAQPIRVDTMRVHRETIAALQAAVPEGTLASGHLESAVAFCPRLRSELSATQHLPVQISEQALDLAFVSPAVLALLHPVRRVDPEHLAQVQTEVQQQELDFLSLQLQRPPAHYLTIEAAHTRLQAKQRELAVLQDTTVRFSGVLYLRQLGADGAAATNRGAP